jgi:molybdate transport system ATP-binding protein
MIEVDLHHRQGAFTLDATFGSTADVTALSGPSGAGKTTILNAIAGLIRPDKGRVAVSGRVLTDTALGIFVPRHKRRIGYVFQDSRLFPHLSVARNLRYGRWLAGGTAPLEPVIDLLGLGALLKRHPRNLSGGETQRVAIGRALLADPALLLLDEPLSSIDEERRAEILPFLKALHAEAGVPILYVSHSQDEIARLAGEVIRVEAGKTAAK